MGLKKRPNHKLYIKILRGMSPEERLRKAFELGEFSRELFAQGLRKAHPELSKDEIRKLYIKRLDKCHNRNY